MTAQIRINMFAYLRALFARLESFQMSVCEKRLLKRHGLQYTRVTKTLIYNLSSCPFLKHNYPLLSGVVCHEFTNYRDERVSYNEREEGLRNAVLSPSC